MLYAIISSFRTLLCSLVMLFFVIYFFGILLCQGVTDYRTQEPPPEEHEMLEEMYGSLPSSLFTLFTAISNGVSWSHTVAPLEGMHFVYPAALMVYIAVVLFGVSNV